MEKKLNVRLLRYTSDPEQIIAGAAKLCYSASEIDSLMEEQTPEKARSFVEKLMNMGHESPIEHVVYTFGVEGVSRVLTHQLVRHRIASYSQQSQRYVGEQSEKNKGGCFDFIVPPSVKQAGLEDKFIIMMEQAQENYDELSKLLRDVSGLEGEENNQDARYVLPNAAETKIITTMNARELLHFFEVRTCNRAQWEIQNLAIEMYKLAFPTAPSLFRYAGPSCISKQKCEEGKMSCGLAEEVRMRFEEMRGCQIKVQ